MVFLKYASYAGMNELSCIIVIAFGAARPGDGPSMAPAPAMAVIFSTSRRDAARMMLAIPASPIDLRFVRGRYEPATGQVNGAAVFSLRLWLSATGTRVR